MSPDSLCPDSPPIPSVRPLQVTFAIVEVLVAVTTVPCSTFISPLRTPYGLLRLASTHVANSGGLYRTFLPSSSLRAA